MTLEDISYITQIIGLLVVIITLIYLSVQVKQGKELLRSDSRQGQVTNDQNGVYKFVEYPEIGRIFSQEETPEFEEKVKLIFWMIGQMRAREHEWLQYKNGALDEETWMGYRGVIYFLLGTKRARALWKLCSPYFNQDFVKMAEGMMKDVPETDFWDRLQEIP
ncbi:hypothetical protein [Robertkochia flava]|uniref:hypothetical protein n=1 Tax=Robertkochia flava TaxID=3447986 RepID=UPI001CC9C84D|nr:hypothetical protein [Robertkochia marina]